MSRDWVGGTARLRSPVWNDHLIAGGHCLAAGILDDIEGQRGIEAEQQDLILDVGLEVTLGDEADNRRPRGSHIEGEGAFDVFAAEKGVAILGNQLSRGEDLCLAGASDREGAFVNRRGVDQLIKGDRDLGTEHHIDFVICWIDVYYEGS